MKILVLGGTGAMGIYVVKQLNSCGHHITVTTRNKHSSSSVRYITGNAKDQVFLNTILQQNWDVIIDFMVYTTDQFAERIELLLKATSHYIFLSSSRVYANTSAKITENSARLLDVSTDKNYLQTDEYALTKARQEDILFKSFYKHWTVIRPYITYDENRLQLGVLEKEDWLYRALHNRTIVDLYETKSKYTTLTHGADVAKGIVSIVGNPEAFGEAFHITSNCGMTWEQVINIYLDVIRVNCGYEPPVLYQTLKDYTVWRKERYQIVYDRMFNRQFCNNKISKFVDTESFVPASEGLRACLQSFLAGPKDFKRINWRAEGIKDRFTRENTSLSEISDYKPKIKYILFRNIEFMKRI